MPSLKKLFALGEFHRIEVIEDDLLLEKTIHLKFKIC